MDVERLTAENFRLKFAADTGYEVTGDDLLAAMEGKTKISLTLCWLRLQFCTISMKDNDRQCGYCSSTEGLGSMGEPNQCTAL